MGATATEAVVRFKTPPRMLFAHTDSLPDPNELVFRLGGDDGVTLELQAKAPGDAFATKAVDLDVSFAEALGHRQEAYERLLEDDGPGPGPRLGVRGPARWAPGRPL